jgi:hypothetical protein
MSTKGLKIFFRITLTFRSLRTTSLKRCSRYRSSKCWDPFRNRFLRQELRGSKLHQDNKGRGKAWTFDWWFHPFSADIKDHEHSHTVWVKISPCHLRNNSVKSLSVQYVHVDMTIANDILKKCTRGSFQLWGKDDHALAVTIIHQGLVGSLPLDEQQLWLPNQQTHDPDSWTAPHLLQLKMEYDVLVNKHRYKVQEMHTVQDHPPPPCEFLLLPPLDSLYKDHVRNQELPQPGDTRPVMPPSQRALSKQMMKYWGPWETNMQKSTNSRMLQQLLSHTTNH